MFTTDKPKLWITLIGVLLSFCCLCGFGLSCLGLSITKEIEWFQAAGKAAAAASQPPAADMALVRRIQGGERLTPELLTGLDQAAGRMVQRTRDEWQKLSQRELPERLGPMKEIARKGFQDLEQGWTDVQASIQRKDPQGVRSALARMAALGDRVKGDVQVEMERLYGPEAPRVDPSGLDPARPTGP